MTRTEFTDLARSVGSDPIAEEHAALNIGREFLPEFAIVVLDGGEPTPEYWDWLADSVQQAQNEHDAEVAAGHEWHG